jgi:hypothetical protein
VVEMVLGSFKKILFYVLGVGFAISTGENKDF